MKKNKEVMTRKSYKMKKEITKVWVKVKKVLIIFFIGFMCSPLSLCAFVLLLHFHYTPKRMERLFCF